MPRPLKLKGNPVVVLGQELLFSVMVLSVATQFCTPVPPIPVFRKTSPEQLSYSLLPVTRPEDESRTRMPQRSS